MIFEDEGQGSVNHAAREGNLVAMQTYIDEGLPIDVPDNRGWIPLLDAAHGGFIDCVEYLLQQGSSVGWTSHEGRTALHLSCEEGHVSCAKLLLDYGADVNAKDFMQNTPLHAATRKRYPVIVQLLLDRGANVNSQQYCGTAPLHIAAADGCTDLARMLLENHAKLDLPEEYGITPLFSAAQFGQVACMEVLLEHCDKTAGDGVVDKRTEDGATALFIASQEGHQECVELLLSHTADANLSTTTPQACPLLAALQFNHHKIVELLIARTKKETLATCDISVFYFSTMHSDPTCTQCLITSGFDVNERRQLPNGDAYEPKVLRFFQHQVSYSTYVSPLALTAILENPLCHSEALIAAGARLNPSSLYEVPPIMPALDRKQLDVVHLLISHGANVNLYHPKVIGNMVLVASLHYWKGLNIMLLCGAEVRSLFSRPGQAPVSNLPCRPRLDDVVTEDEGDYENEPGVHLGPVPLWQLLAQAKYVLSRRGITASHILHKLLLFVSNVWLDPRLASCLDSDKEWKAIKLLQESPRDLSHLCRLVIRRQFSPAHLLTPAYIEQLPLPHQILDYLNYKDEINITG